jgi:hypothetical protein
MSDPTTDELLGSYRQAAIDHAKWETSDSRVANRAHDAKADVVKELRRRGPSAQAKLLELLDDPEEAVRLAAATHSLEFAPERALEALYDIQRGTGLNGLKAVVAVREWRAGRLRFR